MKNIALFFSFSACFVYASETFSGVKFSQKKDKLNFNLKNNEDNIKNKKEERREELAKIIEKRKKEKLAMIDKKQNKYDNFQFTKKKYFMKGTDDLVPKNNYQIYASPDKKYVYSQQTLQNNY